MIKIGTKVYPLEGLMDIVEGVDVKDIYGIVVGHKDGTLGNYPNVTWLTNKENNPIRLFKDTKEPFWIDYEDRCSLTTDRKVFLKAYADKEERFVDELLDGTNSYIKSTLRPYLLEFLKGKYYKFSTTGFDPLTAYITEVVEAEVDTDKVDVTACVGAIDSDKVDNEATHIITADIDTYLDAVNAVDVEDNYEVDPADDQANIAYDEMKMAEADLNESIVEEDNGQTRTNEED